MAPVAAKKESRAVEAGRREDLRSRRGRTERWICVSARRTVAVEATIFGRTRLPSIVA